MSRYRAMKIIIQTMICCAEVVGVEVVGDSNRDPSEKERKKKEKKKKKEKEKSRGLSVPLFFFFTSKR